jgi:hypothetical protein
MRSQFLLGDESDRHRQGRGQHDRVDIAGVIGDKHPRLAPGMLQTLDPQADAAQAHAGPRNRAGEAPAQASPRQKQYPRHGGQHQ